MSDEIAMLLTAFVGGSFLAGLAALWKSRKEAENLAAQAAANMVSAADDVVTMLHQQMARMDARLDALESSHVAYEVWAQKVVDLLDRMLATESAASWHEDVSELKRTQPKHKGGNR